MALDLVVSLESRNHLFSEGRNFTPMEVIDKAKHDEEEWRLSQEVEVDFKRAEIEFQPKK